MMQITSKMLAIVQRDNFLDALFQAGYQVFPFSQHGTTNFFDDMNDLAHSLEQHAGRGQNTFLSGRAFLESLKHLLAKISIQDWSPLDEQFVRKCIQSLGQWHFFAAREHINGAATLTPAFVFLCARFVVQSWKCLPCARLVPFAVWRRQQDPAASKLSLSRSTAAETLCRRWRQRLSLRHG
jgi:hypothetical protein